MANNRLLALSLLSISAAIGWSIRPTPSSGCAAVGRNGGTPIVIAEESAIIVWDAAAKVQHFIRRATFETVAPDFGFLVPTPSEPKLAEVADDAFKMLDELIKPRVVSVSGGVSFAPLLMSCALGSKARFDRDKAMPAGAVQVLQTQQVGGFDAVVLAADDPKALSEWLNRYGYVADPELGDWLAPYVTANWKITAFKIMQDPKTGKAGKTSAVRMSFAADKPFFPYREPRAKDADKEKDFGFRGGRVLRVFFIGAERVTGSLADKPWHASTYWAGQLDPGVRPRLATDLGVGNKAIPADAWLTTFHDSASPRPGAEDVYFSSSSDQSAVEPPPIKHYGLPVQIPIDAVLVVVLVGFLAYRTIRRGRAAFP